MSERDDQTPRVRPSRAQKKRAVEVYEVLARELVEMTIAQFSQVGVPEVLRDEVELARRTRGMGSRKRQTQYLAGVLRRHEDATQAVIATLQRQRTSHHTHQVLFHSVEDLRDKLCDAERCESALREAQALWPALELGVIERLAGQVHAYGDRRARREIFRRLREAAERAG